MNQSLRTWIGLACASPAVRAVPPGTWALEEALSVLADRLTHAEVSFESRGRGAIAGSIRELETKGCLVPVGHGMGAYRRLDAKWQLEHRALAAAHGSETEQAVDEAGLRLAYLTMLSVRPSNTRARGAPER